mmetsp:Transcript_155447/g.274497  ORF Transcript_155447/g.274497 Transcript_155447/m.274497 type:complete len:369 (+) Transcript_155447:81-1187(+)
MCARVLLAGLLVCIASATRIVGSTHLAAMDNAESKVELVNQAAQFPVGCSEHHFASADSAELTTKCAECEPKCKSSAFAKLLNTVQRHNLDYMKTVQGVPSQYFSTYANNMLPRFEAKMAEHLRASLHNKTVTYIFVHESDPREKLKKFEKSLGERGDICVGSVRQYCSSRKQVLAAERQAHQKAQQEKVQQLAIQSSPLNIKLAQELGSRAKKPGPFTEGASIGYCTKLCINGLKCKEVNVSSLEGRSSSNDVFTCRWLEGFNRNPPQSTELRRLAQNGCGDDATREACCSACGQHYDGANSQKCYDGPATRPARFTVNGCKCEDLQHCNMGPGTWCNLAAKASQPEGCNWAQTSGGYVTAVTDLCP